jgi:DNA-binding NarL/FixJ family response regulator
MVVKHVRIVIVDPQPVVRRGLRSTLEDAGLRVVGEASTAAEARELVRATIPDVAIIDPQLPDGSGIELLRGVRSEVPRTACIVFTSLADDETFFQSVVAGAAAWLFKDARPDELLDAVHRSATGASLIRREILDELRARPSDVPDDVLFANFTPRERRILGHLVTGQTNREIAREVRLAEKTVRNHVSTMLGKAGMRNRTQLAAAVARMRTPR